MISLHSVLSFQVFTLHSCTVVVSAELLNQTISSFLSNDLQVSAVAWDWRMWGLMKLYVQLLSYISSSLHLQLLYGEGNSLASNSFWLSNFQFSELQATPILLWRIKLT